MPRHSKINSKQQHKAQVYSNNIVIASAAKVVKTESHFVITARNTDGFYFQNFKNDQ